MTPYIPQTTPIDRLAAARPRPEPPPWEGPRLGLIAGAAVTIIAAVLFYGAIIALAVRVQLWISG